jgi:hypothetical protein
VDYKRKESALLAIKHLNGQCYLHNSRIPIEVRFKEKKYNSYMAKKHEKDDVKPFDYVIDNIYQEIVHNGQRYFYNFKTCKSQYETPGPGAQIFKPNGGKECYFIKGSLAPKPYSNEKHNQQYSNPKNPYSNQKSY